MAMNVGELVATLDVDDRGYSRGLTTAAAEARVAANRIEDHLDDIDADGAGHRTGNGFVSGLLGGVDQGRPRLISSGQDAGGGLSSGVMRGMGGLLNNVWIAVGVAAAAVLTLPAVGAIAGTGLALAFGGGIAAVGIMAAAQADEVRDAFGDLRDTVVRDLRSMAAPLEGTLAAVAGDLGDLFDSLSPHLEDAFADMAPVLSEFSNFLFGAFEGAGPVIDDATEAFNALLEALGPELDESIGGIWDALSDLFGTIAENPQPFVGLITGAFNLVEGAIRLVDWLSQVYVWLQEHIPGGILGLLSPMGLLTGAFGDASEKSQGFRDAMAEMGGALQTAWEHIRSGAEDLWAALEPILQDLWEALANSDVLETVREWWSQISEIFALGGELLGELMSIAATALTFVWENWGQNILGILGGLWTQIEGLISGALEIIKGLINTFLGVITGDWDRAWEGVKQMASGVWTAIRGLIEGQMQIIHNVITGALTGIQMWWGRVWGQVRDAASTAWSAIRSRISSAISGIQSRISSGVSSARSAVAAAWSAVLAATAAAWSAVRSAVGAGIRGAISTVRSTLGSWRAIGRQMVYGIVSGVSGAAGALYSRMRGLASSALQSARNALGIASPSRVMAREVGRWIPEGVAAGLSLGQRRLDRQVRSMADSVARGLGDPPDMLGRTRDGRALGADRRGGPAVVIERFEATERMSAHDVGEALYGLVVARG